MDEGSRDQTQVKQRKEPGKAPRSEKGSIVRVEGSMKSAKQSAMRLVIRSEIPLRFCFGRLKSCPGQWPSP